MTKVTFSKFLSVLAVILFLSNPIFSQKSSTVFQTKGTPELKWDISYLNKGNTLIGTTVVAEFPFINSGTGPLIIGSATTPNSGVSTYFPKQMIPVGGKGVVTVVYEASSQGFKDIPVKVLSNTGQIETITLHVRVSKSYHKN